MSSAASLGGHPSSVNGGAGPVSWRRQLGLVAEHECQMRITRHMVHESPDGRVFRVRWLVCDGCGQRWRDVRQQETTLALPKLYGRGVVAAVEEDCDGYGP